MCTVGLDCLSVFYCQTLEMFCVSIQLFECSSPAFVNLAATQGDLLVSCSAFFGDRVNLLRRIGKEGRVVERGGGGREGHDLNCVRY